MEKLFFKKLMLVFLVPFFVASCVVFDEKDAGNERPSVHPLIIKDYAAYNLWANQRYADWLLQADSAQFYTEVESSFNTLAKTAIHLWNAESGWLNTIKREPWGESPGNNFSGSPAELLQNWISASKAFADYAETLSAEELQSIYFRQNGDTLGTGEQLMLHVFNHATYHRGQLITMGRQVGLKNPPRADYIFYINQ
jgi:uncharacterized damage-inducible protein DinB